MTQEQKDNMLEAIEAESTVGLVEFTEEQVKAMKLTNCYEKRDEIVASATASVIRGKVQTLIDQNHKAFSIATQRNKPAVAAEALAEIKELSELKAQL